MIQNNNFTKRWNIFARELETMLTNHNIQLSYLHEEVPIFPDKIRRLTLSLSEPNSFPVLREDELQSLVKSCHLNTEEVLQLRAALLVTAVEKLLIEHISSTDALQIADTLLPAIFRALQQKNDEDAATNRGDLFLGKANSNIQVLEKAWEACDNAEIALQLSYSANATSEQIAYTRQAIHFYEEGREQMEQAEQAVHNMRAWKDWYAEIQRGQAIAGARLKSLEK